MAVLQDNDVRAVGSFLTEFIANTKEWPNINLAVATNYAELRINNLHTQVNNRLQDRAIPYSACNHSLRFAS